jgi:hypothetical protein
MSKEAKNLKKGHRDYRRECVGKGMSLKLFAQLQGHRGDHDAKVWMQRKGLKP